ncbi:hypothetical protein K4F52_001838 [Lecanicillium sp. MT-2017a]|nr:hypothetical protein K4F52_001838 [Lecanicillium sp. MT-2017a]
MEVYVAGAAAAFTVDMLIFPLDTLKTRYQSQDYLKTYSSSSKRQSSKPLALRGLYQGVGSAVVATLPAAGVFFSTYEASKTTLSKALPLPDPIIHSAASSVAEAASCLILAPAEVIKQHAQMLRAADSKKTSNSSSTLTSPQKQSTSLHALRSLYTSGSASSRLFSGYTALVARNLPFTALQFPLFEHARSWLWATRDAKGRRRGIAETGMVAGGSAASAGALAAFITTPSDVVKTRMMLAPGEGSSWEVAKRVCREKGVRGLFRGGAFRSAWTAVGSGLYLGTYDAAKLWLTRRKPQLEDAAM